ncbi:MAG TPA: hypothetical protein VK639_00220 [Terriglobales bacterium]|jgi:hypothetical protein|nr:hypothetical protein [Terriglobales bacterium]
MKFSNTSKGLLLGLALLLATSAFAANKGSLQVSDTVNVSGKSLAAGEYNVKWEGNGPNVELNILQGKKVVATIPARLIDLDRSAPGNTSVVKRNEDGSKTLSEIRFAGKKYALALGDESAKADTGDSTK